MDLTAYKNIEDLDAIAQKNGIDVPRLRGYRLMADQKPITDEEIQKEVSDNLIYNYRSLERICTDMLEDAMVQDIRAFDADMSWISMHRDSIVGFERRFKEQCAVYNKYAGRNDVLMIHSRMGGTKVYDGDYNVVYDLKDQPWFLDHVRDAYDDTYCDIYAKIEPIEEEDKDAVNND